MSVVYVEILSIKKNVSCVFVPAQKNKNIYSEHAVPQDTLRINRTKNTKITGPRDFVFLFYN